MLTGSSTTPGRRCIDLRGGTALKDMLRNRLVCGIANQCILCRLPAEPDLTFPKGLELAQAAEAADWNTRVLERGAQPIHIHKIGRKAERSQEHTRQGVGLSNCIATVAMGSTNRSSAMSGTVTAITVGRKDIQRKYVAINSERRKDNKSQVRLLKRRTSWRKMQREQQRMTLSATHSLFTLTEQTEATPLLVDMTVNKVPLQMK